MKSTLTIIGVAFLYAAIVLPSSLCAAVQFEQQFQNPPEETKPWCYWYWYNSDITLDGITKDLEALNKAGIRVAMIGNIFIGAQAPGTVKMFTPEWNAATRHAMSEGGRLGMEIYMFNSPGWSQSGGPWIKPEQSMRRVVWNEVPATGGTFSAQVRNAPQDIAVLAVPKKKSVSIPGVIARGQKDAVTLAKSSWIWHPAEDGANTVPAGTKYFKKVFQADPSTIEAARMRVSADNSFVLWINDKEVCKGSDWKTPQNVSVGEYLKPGTNVIAISVLNSEASPSGLIAALILDSKDGKQQLIPTDGSWLVSSDEAEGWRENAESPQGWQTARVLGAVSMNPWHLSGEASQSGKIVRFEQSEPFTARGLRLLPKAANWAIKDRFSTAVMVEGKLYALGEKGARTLSAEVRAVGSNPGVDFLPMGEVTYSFKDATAKVFEFEGTPTEGVAELILGSAPLVASVVEKQLGRVHPTPTPTWESYIFPDTQQPDDASSILRRSEVLNLTDKLDSNGVLTCELPPGDWTILYFGMVTTGKKNGPAPPEGTGLECDKMSKEHIRFNFHSMFDGLLKDMTPEERKGFKGVTIDSYEVGSQNWTDGFDKTFAKRNGYDPVQMLPVLTGRVVESAKDSDGFLSDLRRTVADLIAENYIGGLREVAAEYGLRTWCENYGHWGFPGEFLTYGGYADQIGGEFWSTGGLGPIECRAASSAAHIYGKPTVFAEAFTSGNNPDQHPYSIKRRGEEFFCEGINHFVLHVSGHQPRDGVPGINHFGTAFHRNTPWFGHSRAWSRYLQRCHFMLGQGEPVADTAVYIGDFAPQMTGPKIPVPPGFDYDYINSDVLLRKVRVEGGELVVPDEKNPARISTRYKMVAMPTQSAAQQMRPQVRARIEELKKQGAVFVDGVPVTAQTMQGLKIAPLVSKETQAIRWKARRLDDGMIFFLSNFRQPGPFEVTLRASGKAPELFNPVTGETRKLARFWPDGEGTRVAINVVNPSDSFFVVFRDKAPAEGSVVKAERDGKTASPAELDLYVDESGFLIGEATQPGTYKLTISDGTQKQTTIAAVCEPLVIKDGWVLVPGQDATNTLTQEVVFDLPEALAKAGSVRLDLGNVNVMVTATLNGTEYETLWMPPFELNVTKALKPGQNRLRVQVVSTTPTTPSFGPEIRFKPVLHGTVK